MNALARRYVANQKAIDYWTAFPIGVQYGRNDEAPPGWGIAAAQEIAMAALCMISDECPFMNAT